MKPFFTIIVPIYKTEPFLEQCLKSLIGQSFTDFECLLINDGSIGVELDKWDIGQENGYKSKIHFDANYELKDQCDFIVNSLVKDDKRFRYYSKPNEGLSATKNYGLELATGQRLVILDSDDYLSKDFLLNAYNAISTNSNGNILYSTLKVTNKGEIKDYEHLVKNLPDPNNLSNLLVYPSWSMTPINYFWSLEKIRDIKIKYRLSRGGEDTAFLIDNLLSQIKLNQNKGINTNIDQFYPIVDSIYYYREFDTQMTKESGFEIDLFTSTTNYISSILPELKDLGIKYYILGYLFIVRFRFYRFVLLHKYIGIPIKLFAKLLTILAVIISKKF